MVAMVGVEFEAVVKMMVMVYPFRHGNKLRSTWQQASGSHLREGKVGGSALVIRREMDRPRKTEPDCRPLFDRVEERG